MQIFSKMNLMFSRSGGKHGIWNLINPMLEQRRVDAKVIMMFNIWSGCHTCAAIL